MRKLMALCVMLSLSGCATGKVVSSAEGCSIKGFALGKDAKIVALYPDGKVCAEMEGAAASQGLWAAVGAATTILACKFGLCF